MPHTILHIDSSPLGEHSVTRKLTAKLLGELKAKHPGSTIITRDFGTHPLPHLNDRVIGAFFAAPEARSAALQEAVTLSDEAVKEVMAADILVIGAPMWNFGIPSSLKAWIDHIVRRGVTFAYTETGPKGLLSGKKAIIASARGGVYSEGPAKMMDHQETYLKTILGFIGIADVSFIRAEGIAMGEAAAKTAMQAAETQLAEAVKRVA